MPQVIVINSYLEKADDREIWGAWQHIMIMGIKIPDEYYMQLLHITNDKGLNVVSISLN